MVPIVLPEVGEIPPDIVDLESFPRWARSTDFPESGWFSYLSGTLWVDLNREDLFTHNGVTTEFATVLTELTDKEELGYYFPPRARLSNSGADLSIEPDGVFISYAAVRSTRVRFLGGHDEIMGSPAMVLEVLDHSSVRKDTKVLRELYWAAEIAEYWLVDARKGAVRFDILRRGKRGYTAARNQDGWLRSGVFGRSFRLTQEADPLGHPRYTLDIRD